MIKTSQTAKLFLFAIPVTKLLLLPTLMTNYVGRDSYIFVFVACLFSIGFLCLALATYKKQEGRYLFDMFSKKWLAYAVCLILFFYYFFKAFYPIMEHELFLEDSLYDKVPSISIFIPVLILVAYFAMKKLDVFGKIADFFFVPVIICYVFLLGLSAFSGDYSDLLPYVFEGVGKFAKALPTLYFFGDFLIIYALFGQFAKDGKLSAIIKVAIIVVIICVVFFAIFTSIFGNIAYRELFALSKISKFNPFITSIARFDWIAILVLLVGLITYIALFIYAASFMFVQVFKKVNRKIVVVAIVTIYFVALTFLIKNITQLTDLYLGYIFYFDLFCQFVLPFVIFFSIKRKKPLEDVKIDFGNTPQGITPQRKKASSQKNSTQASEEKQC